MDGSDSGWHCAPDSPYVSIKTTNYSSISVSSYWGGGEAGPVGLVFAHLYGVYPPVMLSFNVAGFLLSH